MSYIMRFDKENKQDEYKYIAKDTNGEVHIGWIVIEQPWYSFKPHWTYWLYYNEYGTGGFCGGCTDLGIKRVKVNPDTIKPFNQIEEIKYCLSNNNDVILEDSDENIIMTIHSEEEIPYELWDRNYQ